MARYADFEYNSEVMDVLFAIVSGIKTVKDISSTLKQPRGTISSKLFFLRKVKAVKKEKWIYEPNWKVLDKALLKWFENWISVVLLGSVKKTKYFMKSFDEKRAERLIGAYAEKFMKHEKDVLKLKGMATKGVSISDITWYYLQGLCQMEDEVLEKIDPKFVELKKALSMKSPERSLFLKSEGLLS